MLDRYENTLKIVCLGLAALLLVRVVNRIAHADPLGQASIPPLPKLTAPSEAKTAAKPGGTETNKVAQAAPAGKDTNTVAKVKKPGRRGRGGFPMGGPRPALNLPAAIQARIDRIKESEILGPFMRPLPMALLGIADDDVFLRAPSGQTGMVKEGDELGGVKLLRIGINRVLVEENGEKKELTLFDGSGSESLMPKETNISTNATNTSDHKEKH